MGRGGAATEARAAIAAVCDALPGGALEDVAGKQSVPFLRYGDVYQFGVARGWSLGRLVDIFDVHTKGEPDTPVWGFDTFTGMPEETPGHPTISIWSKGHFSPGGPAANASLGRALGGRVEWVIGDYEQTLVPSLRTTRGMEKARYVDIDCDLYRSAHRALHWLFASGLVGTGTVIGYDDFWDLPCSARGPTNASARHPLESGEGRAHAEMTKRFGVHFRCICGPCQSMSTETLRLQTSWRTYFVVESVGWPLSNHGFAMPYWQHAQFLEENVRCRRNFRNWQTYPAKG